jgi:hypothetical protein
MMNNENRNLKRKLAKLLKDRSKILKEEKNLLALYKRLQRQEDTLSSLQEESLKLHDHLRLPFMPNGNSN